MKHNWWHGIRPGTGRNRGFGCIFGELRRFGGVFVPIFLAGLVGVLLAGTAYAQVLSSPTNTLWSGYHYDNLHGGQNPNSSDITSPGDLNLVWVFPREGQGISAGDERVRDDENVVPAIDPAFVPAGDIYFNLYDLVPFDDYNWVQDTHPKAYVEDDQNPHTYWKVKAISREDTDSEGRLRQQPVYATWYFSGDDNPPRGTYRIYVWVPAFDNNTTQAEYTVYDEANKTNGITYKIDQAAADGWVLLSTRYFDFSGADPNREYRVVLSNITDHTVEEIEGDPDDPGNTADDIQVVADAIKFVPGTGMEIYSSPASAELFYQYDDGDYRWPTGASASSILTPFVYVGTVESPLGYSGGSPDTGHVYCINSVTPTTQDIWKPQSEWVDPRVPEPKDEYRDTFYKLAQQLGTAAWSYPKYDPATWHPLEGPIEGGIYSSPTLAYVGTQLMCFVTAMDGQVYALDALTGQLIWRGPGVMVSEHTDPATATWNVIQPTRHAYGGSYRWVECDAEGGDEKVATWNFTDEMRLMSGEPPGNLEGWSYAVYAWIPVPQEEGKHRIRDATYTITYQAYQVGSSGGSVVNKTAEVTVDQSLPDNQGRWVRLGSSYFNVSKVTLSNVTRVDDAVDELGNPLSASDFAVVADAVRIIPDTMGPFSYSSPVVDVVDSRDPTDTATTVYAVNTAGRALAFDVLPDIAGSTIGRVKWIYPAIRSKLVTSGEADADQPSMGEVAATPAFYDSPASGPRIFVASYNGHIYCIEDRMTAPELIWEFPDPAKDTELTTGFTSSPAIDPLYSQLFIGSVGGTFYCLHTELMSGSQLKWKYPDTEGQFNAGAPPSGAPLGSFRFSTPAIADDSGAIKKHRVWVGSSDGKIYSFDATNVAPTDGRRIYTEYDDYGNIIETHGRFYVEPSTYAPIQGSVALDATVATKDLLMFVGDMAGVLHWYNATTGTSNYTYTGWQTEGQFFSSPNITDIRIGQTHIEASYIYIGGSDGRLYAFAQQGGAWGGRWSGGFWPFEGDPNDTSQKVETPAPDTDIQLQIFDNGFYDRTRNFNPDQDYLNPGGWQNGWPGESNDQAVIVSENMKMPDQTAINDIESKTGEERDTAIDEYLRQEALKRHDWAFHASDRVGADGTIYFEWGETINVILWNLPPEAYLEGSGNSQKKRNIQLRLTNASPGESAGSMLSFTESVQKLEEYTVLNRNDWSSDDPQKAQPLKYSDEKNNAEVKRCYAVAQIEIKGNSTRPPSPGPGWQLTVTLKRKTSDSDTAPYTTLTIPLAKLRIGTGPATYEPVIITPVGDEAPTSLVKEQPIGINNPLAIRDEGSMNWLGWNQTFKTNRYDPDAHFNGNASWEDGPSGKIYGAGKMPLLDLETVSHGASSREARLGVMDRSALGCHVVSPAPALKTEEINRFRIAAKPLKWQGGGKNIVARLPWDLGVGSTDYPHIYERYQYYRKATDDKDPSGYAPTTLPPVLPPDPGVAGYQNYDDATMRPDTVFTSVEVPKFQPPNEDGYSNELVAYVDSNGNRQFDSGTNILGRPSVTQEAYRRFTVGLKVPPDPRIIVEEQVVDVGSAPHGLGVKTDFPFEFCPYNANPDVQKWFKKLTVKNAGNVNLYNLRLSKAVELFSDQAAPVFPITGDLIISSFDTNVPPGAQPFVSEPFYTSGYGFTLSKPKVGDPDPTILTIPDQRKWDTNYNFTQADAAINLLMSGWVDDPADASPLSPKVSVMIPLTQPVGTYYSWNWESRNPEVLVFADWDNDGRLDSGEPYAAPGFQLKVSVRENQLTGDTVPETLPQIDSSVGGPLPLVGDATPAAFRNADTGTGTKGDVHLFWSSNRLLDPSLYPNFGNPADPAVREFAKAPWFINHASLQFEGTDSYGRPNWAVNDSIAEDPRWWTTPGAADVLPTSQWPKTSDLLTWGGASPPLYSVKHYSPVIAQNPDVPETASTGRTWLAWAGSADVKNSDGTISKEYGIFYKDITQGDMNVADVYSIEHGAAMEKRYPSLAVFEDQMWMFWQGGEKGDWSIFYSVNRSENHVPYVGDEDQWTPDRKLRTPDCLASAVTPNAVHRKLAGGADMLDVVYSGVSRLTQNSDIFLGRYFAFTEDELAAQGLSEYVLPSSIAQPMARVFGQKLEKDPTYGFFSSQHLAWIRPSKMGYENINRYLNADPAGDPSVLYDHPGRAEHALFEVFLQDPVRKALADAETALYNMPYIWVEVPPGYDAAAGLADQLPAGYTYSPVNWTAGAVVSATDGSIRLLDGSALTITGPDGPVDVGPKAIIPEIDEATGIYTYKYENPLTKALLGDTLVDFSAGVVRFTQPLKEVRQTDGSVLACEVRADYTPRTWRLTTDHAVDSSPRAFIEDTPFKRAANPGWNGQPGTVDRLWVFWRKAGTGVDSSTIFYKTYRVGIDLTQLTDADGAPCRPVKWNVGGGAPQVAYIEINGAAGPWEVDRSGRKIYFTQSDERYAAILPGDGQKVLGGTPPPVTVQYTNEDGVRQSVTVRDVTWVEELPEQSLFAVETSVNEGSIYAFADPAAKDGTLEDLPSSKIWVFWTSTRGGTSDLFWETLSPDFAGR